MAVPDGDLSGSATSLLAGDQPVGESSALWWRDGHLGVLARAAADDAEPVPTEWAPALGKAETPFEAAFLRSLARAGVAPVPEIGHESPEGIMIDAAWPDLKVAAYVVVHAEDKDDLERAGWRVVEAEVGAVTAALASAGGAREGH